MARTTTELTLKVQGTRVEGSSRAEAAEGATASDINLAAGLARRQGQRATEQSETLPVRRASSALHATAPRKRSAPDQVCFQRRWQQTLRGLRRAPNKHHRVTANKGGR